MGIEDYSQLYNDAAQQYNLDPALLMAQGEYESGGDPEAIGEPTQYGRAKGLAQFIPPTAKALGITKPNDPKQAIFGQAKLMRENLDRYKDQEKALMAYHGGTNEANWGPKTHSYPANVFKHYKSKESQMADNSQIIDAVVTPASNTIVDEEDIDPVEYARKKIAERQGTSPQTEEDIDPVVYARDKIAKRAAEEKKKQPEKPVGTAEDLALTAPSSIAKGVGIIEQPIAYGVNALTNTMGEAAYGARRLAGYPADEEMYKKLTNINPIFTGNTIADPLIQSVNAIMQQPAPVNPLSGDILHEPQGGPARYENAIIQTLMAGKAGNTTTLPAVKTMPLITGALGGQTASELLPGSPMAQLVGGLAGGAGPSAVKSIKLRASPEEVAGNILQNKLGGLSPEGEFSFVKENPLVPGVVNTLTDVTGSPNLALTHKQLEERPHTGDNPFKERERANSDARKEYFEKASGSRQDIESMQAAREAQRKADTDAIFKPGQEAKATPVIKKIDEILNGPGGKRTAVKNTLTKIREMIATEKGAAIALEKNPEVLYRSVKLEMEDMMDKKNLNNAEGRQASFELNQVKHVLDDVIEKATPGYKKYLENYSKASAKIDAAQWLQDLKLTDAGGNYTLAKVKNALENAQKQQRSRGIQDAKHLTSEQMETLQNLHDDLLKRDQPRREASAKGSDTKQNLLAEADVNSKLGKANEILGIPSAEAMGVGAGSILGHLTGIPGLSYAGSVAGRFKNHLDNKRAQLAQSNLQNFILNPQDYKNYLLNGSSETYSQRFLNKLLQQP